MRNEKGLGSGEAADPLRPLGVAARVVWDGGDEVLVPPEMGQPRADQLQGTVGERLSELAGRCCYDSLGRGRSSADYQKHILEVGHLSVYEHHPITVWVGAGRAGGRDLSARTLANRPGLWVKVTREGVRLTTNARTVLEWDLWSDPGDPDAAWLGAVLRHHAGQAWPRIVERSDPGSVLGREILYAGRQVGPEEGEEKWASLFISGSRGMTHELVRHGDRTAISQRSTRFVNEEESPWVVHPALAAYLAASGDREAQDGMASAVRGAQAVYGLVSGRIERWLVSRGADRMTARKQARGAARGFLGNALSTELVFSASVAQWKRMIRLRASDQSDAEIRGVFAQALEALKACRWKADFEGFDLAPAADGAGQVLVERARQAVGR